ncbi:MAG: polysaccharide ABC transporter ATP-binding protein [Verrucomicrobia bacterium]|nr:polysaccharide ABC transporter ATP-binding protein [Verrucomicrobiota bacterium]
MSDVVIQVDHLWKKYRLGVLGTGTLRHDFNRWLHRTLGKGDPYAKVGEGQKSEAKGTKKEDRSSKIAPDLQSPISDLPPPASSLRDDEMWALRDVSFEVKQGEILGIIGRNGAGKSTLLKILSRVTVPTSGEVRVKGRIASLLEVGTGFHPELTGRENIFLNGAILGMTKGEIKKKFDEIVAFSEVEKFIDTPVKRYSSGMYVRLAFAVAAHLDPEILIVDEVLAVGDAQFQKKCLGKLDEVAKAGRTVLFVSHNMIAVRSLCTRVVSMEEGQLRHDGNPQEAIAKYSQVCPAALGRSWHRPSSLPRPSMAFETIAATLRGHQPQLVLQCDVWLESSGQSQPAFISVDICDQFQTPIMQALPTCNPFIPGQRGKCRIDFEVDLPPLIPGHYTLDFWVGSHFTSTTDYVKQVAAFEVVDSPAPGRSFPHTRDHGFLVPPSRCKLMPA